MDYDKFYLANSPEIKQAYIMDKTILYLDPFSEIPIWKTVYPYTDEFDYARLANPRFIFRILKDSEPIPTIPEAILDDLEDLLFTKKYFFESKGIEPEKHFSALGEVAYHFYIKGGMDNNDSN